MNILAIENLAFSKEVFTVEGINVEVKPHRYLSNSPLILSTLKQINSAIIANDQKLYDYYCAEYYKIMLKERQFQPELFSLSLAGNFKAIFELLQYKAMDDAMQIEVIEETPVVEETPQVTVVIQEPSNLEETPVTTSVVEEKAEEPVKEEAPKVQPKKVLSKKAPKKVANDAVAE